MNSLQESSNIKIDLEKPIFSHDLLHRKKIGAFYTPLTVSSALTNWGIRSSSDLVFEPCFGGCTFLEAAVLCFERLGNNTPENNLFGCDIDPLAFKYLEKKTNLNCSLGNFVEKDFLEYSDQENQVGKFDLIVGNPPYIKHSSFSASQRKTAMDVARNADVTIHGRANLWAYFIVHALNFLNPNGRLGFVLPGSFLYADYSIKIKKLLLSKFRFVTALTVSERLFVTEGTEETTVVLLAEGFGTPSLNKELSIRCMDSVSELSKFLDAKTAEITGPATAYPGHGLIPIDVGTLCHRIASTEGMRTLKQVASLRIGLVTGDKPYFVKTHSEWEKLEISESYLQYIMPLSQYVPGLTIEQSDRKEHLNGNVRCLGLRTGATTNNVAVTRYLDSYPRDKREKNATFKRRALWHQFNDIHDTPDAFFVFMADNGPRIILNNADATCTNAMYRCSFLEHVTSIQKKIIALSMCTTFTQLFAEIVGHPRGSGALKLEPSSALKLALFLPDDRSDSTVDSVFLKVNEELKKGNNVKASELADEFLFNKGELALALPTLKSALQIVRNRRIR